MAGHTEENQGQAAQQPVLVLAILDSPAQSHCQRTTAVAMISGKIIEAQARMFHNIIKDKSLLQAAKFGGSLLCSNK